MDARVSPETTVVEEVLFCYGCNEKLAALAAGERCPQCGQPVRPIADAPTIALDDLAARGTYVGGDTQLIEPEDSLVGLHLGVYHLNAFLGKGGMARVYRAQHLMLERACAIKVLNPQLVERNPEYVELFLSEARAAASLVHPHVVTIHTIGQDRDLHYIEMEYVIGRSLHRFIESAGSIDPTLATQFMVQICSALAEAHRMGMVHRDIKPANVLVTSSGVAKLADFGLAKRVVSIDASAGHAAAGTPHYMAPELFEGGPAGTRSDIYAMGVTYFFLLTGRLPFFDESFTDLAIRHATDPVPDIRRLRADAPDDAIPVIERCLAKNPADRYSDAVELHDVLKSIYGGLRSLGTLLRDAFAGAGLNLSGSGDQYSIVVPLASGRRQVVHIEACRSHAIADRIVKIYSVCGLATADYYERALKLNAEIPHGSVAIENIDGQPHFVMGNTYPRSTCDPEEVRQSVLTIAEHADAVEQIIGSTDRN